LRNANEFSLRESDESSGLSQ